MQLLWRILKPYRRRIIMLIAMCLGYLWFFILEATIITPEHLVYFPYLDDRIPFMPIFIIPYICWFFYMFIPGVVLFFHDETEFLRFASFITGGFGVSCLVYTFWTNGITLRPDLTNAQGIFNALIRIIYEIDTPANNLPSLHVAFSVAAHTAIARYNSKTVMLPWVRPCSALFCMLIIASTVLIKQHSILDLFIGLILGIVLYLGIYTRKTALFAENCKLPLISPTGTKKKGMNFNMENLTVRLLSLSDIKHFVEASCRQNFDVEVVSGEYFINGKSFVSMFCINIEMPITVKTNGATKDEYEAFCKEIEKFIII